MKFENVVISSFAHHIPDKVMSSEELESRLAPLYKKLKLPHGRLELMTGITERRYWEPGTKPSDLSTQAAKNLFAKGVVSSDEVDMIIHSSVCRDFLEPSTASVVHHNLELRPEAMLFDLSNACLGVLSSFVVAANMIESGAIKHALIVSGENGGPLLFETIDHLLKDTSITRKNIKKYIASLTIGSAAVAYTLSHKDCVKGGHQLLGGAVMADSSANVLCQGGGDTHSLMMETDSEALMKAGVKLAKTTWDKAKGELGWTNDSADIVIGHQVGTAHEKLTMEALGLDHHETYTTYQTLGNTGSAALPITLNLLDDNKPIEKGSLVGLLGIGSGLNSIMMGVKW